MQKRLTTILALTLAASSIFAPAALAKPDHAAQNQTDYYEHNNSWTCEKYDTEMGPEWRADAGYGLVVLKSAREHDSFKDVKADDLLETRSGKDISHIIVCGRGFVDNDDDE